MEWDKIFGKTNLIFYNESLENDNRNLSQTDDI